MFCALVGLVLAQANGIVLPTSACVGWKAGKQEIVAPSGIFQYMDGAGELYLGYGFKKLYVRGYEKPGQPKVTCELYQMPSSADAYGLFSQDRTGSQLRIGQGAIYASGLLMTWQGKWFVRILADRDTPEAKRCSVALAKAVVKLCGPDWKLPAALAWLPKAGLDPKSVHFFHTHTCLNYFHFLATENLLGLSLKTEAVMGTYSGNAGKSLAVVIGYPKAAEAQAAWLKFRRVYLKGLRPSGAYSLSKLENGRWVAGIAKGRRVLILLESPSHEECAALIEALARKP